METYNLFGINDTGAVVLKQSTLDFIERDLATDNVQSPLLGKLKKPLI